MKFDYSSLRSKKARLAHYIAHSEIYWLLAVAGLAVFVGGIVIAWSLGSSLGWLVAGLAGPFWFAAGVSRDLKEIPSNSGGQGVDDLADAEVLGMLHKGHSPRDLATIAMHLPGGRFFAARFGLGTEFLAQLVSSQPADSARVWEEADRLRVQAGRPNISSAALTAALIRTIPGIDQNLAGLKIGTDEIVEGYAWHDHLHDMIEAHKVKPKDGGIGRDWAFGYTPTLGRFGRNISLGGLVPLKQELPSRDAAVGQITHLLSQAGKRNAAIVGGLGSGKTTVAHSFAAMLMSPGPDVPSNLRFRQVMALDPSSLISQTSSRGELEGLVNQLLMEAYNAKNIILFLDDAQLFFEEAAGGVNLSNVLLPVLEGGGLPLILSMDEQRWLQISRANPALAQHLNRVMLQPADGRETMLIMQDQVIMYEYQYKAIYTYQALAAAYRLSSRFLAEQVMPGRALKLLESAANTAEQGLVTAGSVEQAIEQTEGVKVGTADSAAERDTLLNLEQKIHERMVNQTRAVQVVSDALRRARAGVRNVNRPVGTFLFLGPTGVGKTELAKSVAAVFFGGEDRVIRLDLNEYVQPQDVSRLIADASVDPHSLTAQIAKNPFSVVLLDEIEKAHPNVLNTLLQMLDEGILRDVNNREVNFREAVIVATSNAGAERIRAHIEAGTALEQFEEQFVNELISASVFRPEFLNRFDEIVLFRPLKPEELMKVVDIILQGVNKTLAAQKVSVVVDDDAKSLLVQNGYDPRLGARPLRRVVQRVVENIVSNQLLSGQVVAGGQVRISSADVKAMLDRGKA